MVSEHFPATWGSSYILDTPNTIVLFRIWYLSLLLPTVAAISPECQSYLMGVARSNSQFQVCALIRARPFSVCTNCYQDYSSAYNTFIELEDVSAFRSLINNDYDRHTHVFLA